VTNPAGPLAPETRIPRRLRPVSRRTDALWILSVAVVYFGAARLGLALVIEPSGIAPVWLPSGVFLAAILLTRRDLRPWLVGALYLTDLVAELLAGTPPALSLVYALTLTGDAVLSAWLLLRFVGNPITFRRVRDVVGWLLLSVLLSNAIAALVAAAAASLVEGASFRESWIAWVIADGIGNLLVTTLALSWAARVGVPWIRQPRRELEAAILIILLAGLNYLAFFGVPELSDVSEFLTYLNFPILLWAALRFEMRGASSALAVVAAAVIVNAVASPGSSSVAAGRATDVALVVQLYIALLAVPTLLLAAVASERSDTDASLREGRALLRSIVEGTSDAVYAKDLEGRYTLFNASAETIMGKSAVEVMGKDDTFLFPPDEAAVVMDGDRRVMQRVATSTYEERLTAADGSVRTYLSAKGPLHDRTGTVTGLFGIAHDITDRTAAEEALRASEEFLLESQAAGSIGSYRADFPADRWMSSPELDRIFGIDAGHARTIASWAELIHPDDREMMTRYLAEDVIGRGAEFRREYRIVRAPDGATRWVDGRGRVTFDAEGRVVALIGTIADITERRAAEGALRESEARHRMILRTALSGFWLVDMEGRLQEVNDAYAAMSGYTVPELLAMRVADLEAVERVADTAAHIERVTAEGQGRFESQHRRKDGSLFDVEVSVQYQPSGGGPLVAFLDDITERKAAEAEVLRLNAELEQRVINRTAALEAANRELRSFSYSVSHDLRAPLRAVAGFAEILNQRYRDRLDETGAHYLDNVLTSSVRMGVLIDELLAYSRLGRGSIRVVPVALAPIVDHLRTVFGARTDEAGATLVVAGPLATPRGDPLLLEQILLNLVDNALTYRRPDVPPQIILSSVLRGRTVTLAVADNGIGIAPEYQERIFEVFTRLHSEGAYPGTGVGLATVRKAARLMGSDVTVASKEGEGSTFSLVLPAAR
jgi:PAS domain S-box-containing protein